MFCNKYSSRHLDFKNIVQNNNHGDREYSNQRYKFDHKSVNKYILLLYK